MWQTRNKKQRCKMFEFRLMAALDNEKVGTGIPDSPPGAQYLQKTFEDTGLYNG